MKMTAEDKRWRAETDAETMARYQEIMNDATRRNAATKIAKQKAADLVKRANAMQKVAGTKGTKRK